MPTQAAPPPTTTATTAIAPTGTDITLTNAPSNPHPDDPTDRPSSPPPTPPKPSYPRPVDGAFTRRVVRSIAWGQCHRHTFINARNITLTLGADADHAEVHVPREVHRARVLDGVGGDFEVRTDPASSFFPREEAALPPSFFSARWEVEEHGAVGCGVASAVRRRVLLRFVGAASCGAWCSPSPGCGYPRAHLRLALPRPPEYETAHDGWRDDEEGTAGEGAEHEGEGEGRRGRGEGERRGEGMRRGSPSPSRPSTMGQRERRARVAFPIRCPRLFFSAGVVSREVGGTDEQARREWQKWGEGRGAEKGRRRDGTEEGGREVFLTRPRPHVPLATSLGHRCAERTLVPFPRLVHPPLLALTLGDAAEKRVAASGFMQGSLGLRRTDGCVLSFVSLCCPISPIYTP
ncbi:hypothetical protein MSAN_01917500 [Mycena sanguinolenta]|uniref:Uncharacterized protein n=1 Tax=Mycena sanguinolenta TaxID=230812 RepID=A0A8H7CNK0_9AGAR|nr:hypothetical protein MSAN_01917500 [Mycena sanguinolenta]